MKITQENCECHIVFRTGETLDSSNADRPCSDVSRIVLCPLHAAAHDLVAALQEIYDWTNAKSTPWAVKARAALAKAKAVRTVVGELCPSGSRRSLHIQAQALVEALESELLTLRRKLFEETRQAVSP